MPEPERCLWIAAWTWSDRNRYPVPVPPHPLPLGVEDRPSLLEVARRFWWPAYGALRDAGSSPAGAAVLTSRLLARLANGSPFVRHDDHDGRLRLLIQSELVAVRDRAGKAGEDLGGPVNPVVDVTAAESRDDYGGSPASPHRFRDRWATVVLEEAVRSVRARARESGAENRLERLLPYLARRVPDWRKTDIAEAVDSTAVENLRDEFRSQVRRIVSDTVTTPMILEAELLDLFG